MMNNPSDVLRLKRSGTLKKTLAPTLPEDKRNTEEDAKDRLITENEFLLPSPHSGAPEYASSEEHRDNYKLESGIQNELDTYFENGEDGGQLENGRLSKLEFSKLFIQECGLLFFSVSGMVLCVVSYDLEFNESSRYSLTCSMALWTNFASSLILIFLTIMRYSQEITFQKARNHLSKDSGIISSGQWRWVIAEIVLILLQPYPFLRGYQFSISNIISGRQIVYNVNDIFYLLIIFRINLPLRIVLNQTQYYSPRAQRICDMYGAEKGYFFTVKCLMKESAGQVISLSIVATLFIFAYALRICERPYFVVDDTVNLENYLNCIWLVILTITTVGYGDYYARTLAARAVLFVGCIWGIFVVSIMVISVTNILNLTTAETKALIILQRIELRSKIKEKAAFILSNMAKIGISAKQKKRGGEKVYSIDEAVTNTKKYVTEFKSLNRQLRALEDSNINEEMSRHFEFIQDEMRELSKMQEGLSAKIQKLSTRLLSTPNNGNTENQIIRKDRVFTLDSSE